MQLIWYELGRKVFALNALILLIKPPDFHAAKLCDKAPKPLWGTFRHAEGFVAVLNKFVHDKKPRGSFGNTSKRNILTREEIRDHFISAPLAYSISEFCSLAGIGRSTFYRLLKQGEISTVQLAGRRLIPAAETIRLFGGTCK
jgi:excisionase family DNA binding protein